MADKNDAREWLEKNSIYGNPEEVAHVTCGRIAELLTAYAAAVTQERDALRRHLEANKGTYTMSAAEESQPK